MRKNCTKTAERIHVVSGVRTPGDPTCIVLDEVPRRRGEGSMRPLHNYFGSLATCDCSLASVYATTVT